jgi:hypothetical protein
VTTRQFQMTRLTTDEIHQRVKGVLGKATLPSGLMLEAVTSASPPLVRSVPPWVARMGEFDAGGRRCVWFEPRPSPAETLPSQIVIDLPTGRYMVDTLDVRASTWCARESAAGGPLVAGLSYVGGPVLLVVTRTGDAAPSALLDQEDPQ